jgi:hypothetical protein
VTAAFRSPRLARLGGVAGATAAAAFALGLAGVPRAATAAAVLLAGLALLGLAVGLNALLRREGLGGDGLEGAAGVLGAALVMLGESVPAVGGVAPGLGAWHRSSELLGALARAGWILVALWIGREGWLLSRLVAPSRPLAWGSVAAAAAVCVTVVVGQVGAAGWGAAGIVPDRLAFLPLALWSASLAVALALGRPVREEAAPE